MTRAERQCSDQDLIDFCTNGHERVQRALTESRGAEVRQVLAEVLASRAAMLGTYETWATLTVQHLAHTLTPEELASWYAPEEGFRIGLRNDMTADVADLLRLVTATGSPLPDELATLVDRGESGTARARWDEINSANQRAHHYRRDLLTSMWTRVYEKVGAEALRDLLSEIGRSPGWKAFLEDSIKIDIVTQVRDFAYILTVGNFGSATITEHADRFELRYTTCGSCGLQELGGRFDAPWDFARTRTELPEFNSGDAATTVYRAHQAMLHSVAAIDTVGKPYPVISCNGPGGSLGCTFLFFKGDVPEEYFTRVGRQPV